MNLALGALAAALLAAILAVLFVGTGDDPSLALPVPTTAAPTTTTSSPQPVSTGSTQPSDAFAIPAAVEGRWRNADGSAIARFESLTIVSFQTVGVLDGESVAVSLVEPAELGAAPSASTPVQAVLFVTTETDSVLNSPQSVLAELLYTAQGLRLSFVLRGVEFENLLVPG